MYSLAELNESLSRVRVVGYDEKLVSNVMNEQTEKNTRLILGHLWGSDSYACKLWVLPRFSKLDNTIRL